MTELFTIDGPPSGLQNQELQKAVLEHTGKTVWSFVSKTNSTYSFKRGRKIWKSSTHQLELAPMKAILYQL